MFELQYVKIENKKLLQQVEDFDHVALKFTNG